jgi:hypothetical protein
MSNYPPYGNCGFELCDLPGQCLYEGKCHHPAKHAKDEITLPISEYEQLKSDKEQLRKQIAINESLLESIRLLELEILRQSEAIDQAMKSTKSPACPHCNGTGEIQVGIYEVEKCRWCFDPRTNER